MMIFASVDDPPLTPYELLQNEIHVDPSYMSSSFADGKDEVLAKTFAELHGLSSVFLPMENVRASLVSIAAVTAVLTIVYFIIMFIVRRVRTGKKKGNGQDEDQETKMKRLGYQINHMFFNLCVGLCGIYTYVTAAPPRPYTVLDKIAGLTQHAVFGEAQIAYQLWSIPAGLWLAPEREPPSMVLHHLGVLFVASVATFFRCGWRYYTPFFFGVVEISSVPLSIVNIFKGDKTLGEQCAKVNALSKLTFAVLFLTVRVWLWLPQMKDFYSLAIPMCATCQTVTCRVVMILTMASAGFLTGLQLFWALKIVRALLGMAGIRVGGGKEKKGPKGSGSGASSSDGRKMVKED